jgi:hypothetical protein
LDEAQEALSTSSMTKHQTGILEREMRDLALTDTEDDITN